MRNFVVYKFSFKLTTTLPKEVYCNNSVCTSYSAQNTFWVSARQLRQAMAKTRTIFHLTRLLRRDLFNKSENIRRSFTLSFPIRVFPRFAPLIKHHRFGNICLFSCAWHQLTVWQRLYVFPRSAQVYSISASTSDSFTVIGQTLFPF